MKEKPRKGARTIEIDGRVWWYYVGKSNIQIFAPNGIRLTKNVSNITGEPEDLLHRGRYKGTSDGMITPAMVKAYIENMSKI